MYSIYHLQTAPRQPQLVPPQDHTSTPAHTSESRSRHQSVMGEFIHFATGQFQGKHVRMELVEIQKADLGRKYARVDRRPLDPPPVIKLKLYELIDAGTDAEQEVEMTYDDVQTLGLLCTVDLFSVPADAMGANHSDHSDRTMRSPSTQTAFSSPSPSSTSSTYSPHGFNFRSPPNHHHHTSSYASTSSSSAGTSSLSSGVDQPNYFSGYILPSQPAPDILYHLNGFPITESAMQTQALVGATFVQPTLIDINGQPAIVFVFSDLAVKIEGTFILRYRVFDIFSRPHHLENELTIAAETYGGTFRVYSTKEFPGLAASTELTKHLSRWGVRLNIRETERRRKRSDKRSRSPSAD